MKGHVAGTCHRGTQQGDTAIVMLKAITVAGKLAERKSKGAYIFATTCNTLWCVAGAFGAHATQISTCPFMHWHLKFDFTACMETACQVPWHSE